MGAPDAYKPAMCVAAAECVQLLVRGTNLGGTPQEAPEHAQRAAVGTKNGPHKDWCQSSGVPSLSSNTS